MSLFNRALRPPTVVSDEAIERYLATLRDQIEPDPLFRRRLRSDVVNRFVAVREGIGQTSEASLSRRRMGRVGRACLYASFTLGVSAVSVLAASEEALPGEVLYPLKQRIEELRMEVVPRHLHGELAAYALGERIEEMGRLVDAGRLDLAVSLAPVIELEYERLATLQASVNAARAARIERHMVVLQDLIASLPSQARDAVQGAIDGTPPRGAGNSRGQDSANTGGVTPARGGGTSPAVPATTDRAIEPTPTPTPTPAVTPEPTPKPDRTPKPRPPEVPPPGRGVSAPIPSLEAQSTP